MTVHDTDDQEFTSSRIDAGEGSCVVLAANIDAHLVLTGDLRLLPKLQNLIAAEAAMSPVVLKARGSRRSRLR